MRYAECKDPHYVVKAAQHIIGMELPTLDTGYAARLKKKANIICKDWTHPRLSAFRQMVQDKKKKKNHHQQTKKQRLPQSCDLHPPPTMKNPTHRNCSSDWHSWTILHHHGFDNYTVRATTSVFTVYLISGMGNFDDREGHKILSSLLEGQIVIVHFHQ